mgnify:FL=1
MRMFTWKEALAAMGGEIVQAGAESFSSVVTDTRKITKGALFLGLKGDRFNGEDFAHEAAAKGAAGIVVSSDCPAEKLSGISVAILRVPDTLAAYQQLAHAWRMRFSLPVIAITGSNGKTTTKDLAAATLSPLGKILKTQANFNNEVGLPLTLLGIRAEHKAAVVEIGMRGLHQIEAMAPIAAPTIGIVTNVGETHMELLGSIENIARAKAELVEAIPAGGTVILNADNPYVAAMRDKAKEGVRVLTFGVTHEADIRARDIVTRAMSATRFTVDYAGGPHAFLMPMLGHHNVYNALAAIAASHALGVDPEAAAEGLRRLEVTQMRFETQDLGDWHIINDAYNASPMSMQAAIKTLAGIVKGRKIAVMGDMLELGNISESAHRKVGQELAMYGFDAVVTRGEMGRFIADSAEAGGVKIVRRCASHEEAADFLHEILQPGDTILFKGSRGMAMERIIDLL